MDYTKEYLKYKRNKKIKGIFIGIGILLIAIIGSTYAFFTYSKSLQAFTLTSSGITASFGGGTNQINITNGYPISDEFALQNLNQLDYIDFTISGNVEDEDQGLTYEIYLTEKDSNTLDPNYIKIYLTDENGQMIKTPKVYNYLDNTSYSRDASLGKLIYNENGVSGNYTKSFRIYAWIDKDYEQNEVSQEFSFYVNLYAYNDENKEGSILIQNKIAQLKKENPSCNYVVEDYDTNDELEATYLSGPAPGKGDCAIDFNYVWWSGKMWRITAIYPDGAMKMVTDNNITTISYNPRDNLTYYDKQTGAKSYVFQWLNEDFLDTLYYQGENVIDKTKYWNFALTEFDGYYNNNKLPVSDETTVITSISPVGLLNSYEYYKSYQNTTLEIGYLNIGYYSMLIDTENYYNDSVHVRVALFGNVYIIGNDNTPMGIRPSVFLKPQITFYGNGTKQNPYRLTYDYDTATINYDLINTRHSGEYVKLSKNGTEELFRIVDVEDNKTKIVSVNYADNGIKNKFGTAMPGNSLWGGGTTTGEGTWYTYLNNVYLPNLIETYGNIFDSSIYFFGVSGINYKLSICASATTDTTKQCEKNLMNGIFKVGLLRYGEMFATQQGSGSGTSIAMWLMSRNTYANTWMVDETGFGNIVDYNYFATTERVARPTLHLKPSVKILSGSGTELDPYIVG